MKKSGLFNAVSFGIVVTVFCFPILAQATSLLYFENFDGLSSVPAPLEVRNGDAWVENDGLVLRSMSSPRNALVAHGDSASWTDYELVLDLDPIEFRNWVHSMVIVRTSHDFNLGGPGLGTVGRGYQIELINLNASGGIGDGPVNSIEIVKAGGPSGEVRFPRIDLTPLPVEPFEVKVKVQKNTIAVSINNDEVYSITDPNDPFLDGGIAFHTMWESEAHFDNIRVVSVIPVPAAVWLFGSGLLGLIGIARRRKA